MGIVVELWSGQSLRVVRDGVNLLIWTMDGEDASNIIVRSISLCDHQSIWNPMDNDRSGGEGILKLAEGGVTGVAKVPWSIFVDELCQRSDDVRVIVNETMVEISEP